jgi:hypothetical protein
MSAAPYPRLNWFDGGRARTVHGLRLLISQAPGSAVMHYFGPPQTANLRSSYAAAQPLVYGMY